MSPTPTYARVPLNLWRSPDFRAAKLTPKETLVLLYWLTSPHSHMSGLFSCPLLFVAKETGVPEDDVRRATLGPLSPWVSFDETTEEVFVHEMAADRMGGKAVTPRDKRAPAVVRALADLLSETLKSRFYERYPWAHRLSENAEEEGAYQGPSSASGKGLYKPVAVAVAGAGTETESGTELAGPTVSHHTREVCHGKGRDVRHETGGKGTGAPSTTIRNPDRGPRRRVG